MSEVTFKDFAAVAKKRGHSVESLADRFRGKIENPSEFFERVMTCTYKGEDRSWVVIPYRSVFGFYSQELHSFGDSHSKHRRCACGCGAVVFDRKKWASSACKKRIQRNGERQAARRFTDMQEGAVEVVDFIEAKPGQNHEMATLALIRDLRWDKRGSN